MTTATMTTSLPLAERGEGLGGWARRAFARLIESREREGRRRVAAQIRAFDDATLASYGMDRHTIAALRRERIHTL